MEHTNSRYQSSSSCTARRGFKTGAVQARPGGTHATPVSSMSVRYYANAPRLAGRVMRHQGEMSIEDPGAGHGQDKACKAAARFVARWPNSWGWFSQNFAQVAGEKARVRVAHDHVSRHRRILQPAQP
eukprot:scaffold10209_cov68-Phaeocystis_antarctica.AAC.4